ncbi:hypothetical protein SAMN05421776_1213 [Nocardia farcinica]|uniref:Uncharacterized protein n=1 Tax=Nocardia farcinica TaxID=37329 RepID=A0A0H5PPF2_NOCFR|nr:hypothetical protein [Nocardia farcinica]AXK88592.1 hypothetical protein DXT66_25880 [Nocardia farcinica]PFW98902.1 hypothetical protein CJ469_05863 [Nocardia farcinica]PFX04508.1 hypothetical protein CJ468_05484 [Nocardia farcinica]CRY84321.1 Uncharacterised protein [Nocardia farcinica]SIT34023.1 hypothetical protein SAMN05421776_1213 [Nocardia farcinica]
MTVMYFRARLRDDGASAIECVNPLPRISITQEFLAELPSEFVSRDGNPVTFRCANGTWTYRLLEPARSAPNRSVFRAVPVEHQEAA